MTSTKAGMKRRSRCALAALLFSGAILNVAHGQEFPMKPVRIVVPYPPGGGVDVVARLISPRLAQQWSQQVVVDNRGGASGNIGTEIVAKAPPDGHTLLMGTNGPIAINTSLYPKLPFDPLKDLQPITVVASGPFVLSIHPSLPARSVKELIALARSKPGDLTFASAGSGSTNHLAGELLKTAAGVSIVHVPYKGGATSLSDVLTGRVSMIFNVIPLTLPHAAAGKLRPLAVTTDKRSSSMPATPTMAEAGVPGYEVTPWFGLLAPSGLPPAILAKIYKDSVLNIATPQMKEALAAQGFEPVGNSPDEFSKALGAEISKWARVIARTGARLD